MILLGKVLYDVFQLGLRTTEVVDLGSSGATCHGLTISYDVCMSIMTLCKKGKSTKSQKNGKSQVLVKNFWKVKF